MNKKGFTLVELLVTIAISTLVLSLGTILVNEMIEKNENKTEKIAKENIKKSANLYSREFFNEIVWLNNESCISVEQLISKGYLRKDKADYTDLKYVIIEKDNNNTIISERNSKGNAYDNNLCGTIIYKQASALTNKDICKKLEYNGTSRTVHISKNNSEDINEINNIKDVYILPDSEVKGTDAGSYIVPISLKEGYKWNDGSIGAKDVYCAIEKGIPDLKLWGSDGKETYGQDAEQTIPIEVTVTSDVNGTIEIKSSNNKYATAIINDNNNIIYANTPKKITIYNNANRKTNTYITVKLNPTNQNYQSKSTTYTIGKITDIKIPKPTEDTHCIKTYYNTKPQTITKNEGIGYTIPDTQFTEPTTHNIKVTLHPGFEWEDGSTNDIILGCKILNPEYFVHYVGNGNTGQTYDDKKDCNDDNECGLERYAKNSKYNSTKKIFEHARIYEYGSTYKLAKNKFTKKGYSFSGWSKTANGNVDFTNYQSVSNLIDPAIDKHNTIVKLYAKWTPNNYKVTYNGNGGSSTEYGTTWSETVTYDTNYKTRSNWYTKKGYTFIGWNEKADGSGVNWTDYINKDWKWTYTKNITLYAQWQPNAYTVTYNGNGGSSTEYGATWSETATYDTNYKTRSNWYTKRGYTFIGWNENTNGSGVNWTDYINKDWKWTYTKNITLYAQWSPKTITVKLDKKNGTGGTNGPIYMKYDTGWYSNSAATTAITSISKPTRTGCTFLGYYYTNSSNNESQIIDSTGKIVAANSFFSADNRTIYAKWRINKVYINYSTNGGSITKNTTENGTKYTWTTNSSGIISRATSSEAATPNFYEYNYGGSTSSNGLANWNNANYINISKTGYGAKSGEQWICLSGACKKNKTYDHNKVYAASDFCDASSGDCTAVLGVNWVDNVKPTCTISKRTTNWDHNGVDITINCSDAGSGCKTASENVDNLKESKTYSVTDNAGNSGSCTVSISSRKMWHKRTRTWNDCASTTTKWKGTCIILSPPNLKGTHSITGAASEEQCRDWCDDRTTGAFNIDCTSYSVCTGGYSNYGSWSDYIYDYNCSNGTSIICKYRTEYK